MLVVRCGPSTEDYGPDPKPEFSPPPIVAKAPVPVPTSLECPKGTYLTYSNFGSGFLSRYCRSCHSRALSEGQRGGAPLAANFETVEEARTYRALILTKTSGSLPSIAPQHRVPENDKTALTEWLRCGAPESNGL